MIGEGAFGKVLKAEAYIPRLGPMRLTVAVKTLKGTCNINYVLYQNHAGTVNCSIIRVISLAYFVLQKMQQMWNSQI